MLRKMKIRTISHFAFVIVLAVGVLLPGFARTEEVAAGYLLGPNDQVSVNLRDVKEIDFKPVRIDSAGNIQLHYVGKLKAAGLTVEELAKFIAARLTDFVNDPVVTVEVTDFGSQPVSVMGAVNKPGVYQLRGRQTLVEVLSSAEGLR